MRYLLYLPLFLAFFLAACGSPDPSEPSSQNTSSSAAPNDNPLSCRMSEDMPIQGQRRLLFLSSKQFTNALQDAGVNIHPSVAAEYLPDDIASSGEDFVFNHSDQFNEGHFNLLFQFALELSENHWLDVANDCADTESCQEAIVTFAETLFRRPLSEELKGEYTSLINEYGLADGIKTGMVSVLTSPHFLYISELGDYYEQKQQYELDAYELASVLSFMYMGSIPDDELLSAAANDELSSTAQIQSQIDRLIQTPHGQRWVGHFAGQWVGTDQLFSWQKQNSQPNQAIPKGLEESFALEVHQWFRYIFYNDEKSLSSFFYDSEFLIDRQLAAHYDAEPELEWPDFVEGSWRRSSDEHRGGILTTAAFMSTFAYSENTSPIRRATQLRKAFLCQYIHFPDTMHTLLEEQHELAAAYIQSGDVTTREYYEYLTDHPVCDTCHKELINPLFGMEDFDHLGMPRTEQRGYGENGIDGLRIDNRGVLIGTESTTDNDAYVFNGTRELGKILSELPAVQACFVNKSFRFLAQTHIEKPDHRAPTHLLPPEQNQDQYACVKDYLVEELRKNKLQPKAVFRKVGTLDSVRYRN